MNQSIEFHINGESVKVAKDDGDMALVDYLHEHKGLTGTKLCCGIGVCHACTVTIQNQPGEPLEKTLACATPVSAVNGRHVPHD